MRIFAICLIKNERDIIAQTLTAAARWCDVVYVHDTGSTDGTWEEVNDLATRVRQVVPVMREERAFTDSLRVETFESYRSDSSEGDWWCVVDADEVYIDEPRAFLSAVPHHYDVVWSSCFEFLFTDRDLERYRQDPGLYADETLLARRLRYYANSWSEPRFFRYRQSMVWDPTPRRSQPGHRNYPVRIRYKHFQYRSPEQIQKRLDTRFEAMAAGHFEHERRENWARYSKRAAELFAAGYAGPPTWEERVVDAATLHYDMLDGRYFADESRLPPIDVGADEAAAPHPADS